MKLCPKCGKQYPDDANFCPVDAGRLVEDTSGGDAGAGDDDDAGLFGGRFARGERIGGGLTGEVYRATDQQSGAACVLKVVDPAVFPTALLQQRSERELKQLERMDSPAVAKVLGHGKDGDSFWVATELVEGARSLDAIVAESGALGVERASALVGAIGKALADAARVGVIHRDLAPKNVLVTTGDQVKLINFGIAVPGKVQGVPEFVAPELVAGKPVDQRSNIYSLGCIYYFLLTGQPPYVGDPEAVLAQHKEGDPVPPSEHTDLPAPIDAIALKALARSSSKRFMTLRQMLGEIETVAAGGEPSTTQPFGRAGAGKRKKKKKLAETMVGGFSALDPVSSSPASESGGGEPSAEDSNATTKKMSVDIPAEARKPKAEIVPEPDEREAQPAEAVSAAEVAQAAAAASGGAAGQRPDPRTTLPIDSGDEAAAKYAARANEQASASPVEAPKVAATPEPSASGSASGKSRGRKKKRKSSSKGKFRETMWFKKGELDAAAAEAAAEEHIRTGGKADVSDKADALPMDERYKDDGTLTAADRDKFSLKTGSTQMMQAYKDESSSAGDVSEKDLIGEMRGGRGKIVAAIIVGILLVGGIIAFAVTHSSDDDSGSETETPAATDDPATD